LLEAFIPLIYSETTPELDDRQLKQIHAAIVGAGNSAATLFQKYDSEASNADVSPSLLLRSRDLDVFILFVLFGSTLNCVIFRNVYRVAESYITLF
jgi:hypothetical protein